MTIKLKAIGHRVLVRVDQVKKEEKSDGGIIIPILGTEEALEMATTTGTIVQFGSQVDKVFLEGAEIGDKIIFSRYEGCAREVDGELFRILPDSCIWGVLKEDK